MDYWDPDMEAFMLDGMSLRIKVEDIYFITGLSHRGKVLNLQACEVGGGLNIDEYIVVYCVPDTEKMGSKVPVNSI